MVISMENSNNFELFYDVLDSSIRLLYVVRHDNFFDLLIQTGKNIIACDVLDEEVPENVKKKLLEQYAKLENIDFNVEDIRKAFQMMALRAFKETNLKMGEVTPDTLGIFFSYLINKLVKEKKALSILDPVIGTGNLLYSVANCLECDLKLYGIDNVREVLEIANVLGNLLNYDIEMFNQDTLLHPFKDIDFVIGDFPDYQIDDKYFPYEAVLTHLDSLKEDGYLIGLFPNDFFSHDKGQKFKERLQEKGSVLGVLQLPLSMFKDNPKSIIIFTKKKLESKKCLLVNLPSFNNYEDLNKALVEIENWFDNNL